MYYSILFYSLFHLNFILKYFLNYVLCYSPGEVVTHYDINYPGENSNGSSSENKNRNGGGSSSSGSGGGWHGDDLRCVYTYIHIDLSHYDVVSCYNVSILAA